MVNLAQNNATGRGWFPAHPVRHRGHRPQAQREPPPAQAASLSGRDWRAHRGVLQEVPRRGLGSCGSDMAAHLLVSRAAAHPSPLLWGPQPSLSRDAVPALVAGTPPVPAARASGTAMDRGQLPQDAAGGEVSPLRLRIVPGPGHRDHLRAPGIRAASRTSFAASWLSPRSRRSPSPSPCSDESAGRGSSSPQRTWPRWGWADFPQQQEALAAPGRRVEQRAGEADDFRCGVEVLGGAAERRDGLGVGDGDGSRPGVATAVHGNSLHLGTADAAGADVPG